MLKLAIFNVLVLPSVLATSLPYSELLAEQTVKIYKQSGKIATGVYGIGMAFPEILPYTMGLIAYKVTAIWPMMKHLKKIFPLWLQEPESSTARHAVQKELEYQEML